MIRSSEALLDEKREACDAAIEEARKKHAKDMHVAKAAALQAAADKI